MISDVKLVGESVIAEGQNLTAKVQDFCLDANTRRDQNKNKDRPRRALVHAPGDILTINYASDYPGGVTIQGDVKIPSTLVVDGEIGLKTSGPYSEPSTLNNMPLPHGTSTLAQKIPDMKEASGEAAAKPHMKKVIVEAGTRTVTIKNGTILIHSVGKPGVVLPGQPAPDVEYTYDLASEIFDLRNRVAELEKKLAGMHQ